MPVIGGAAWPRSLCSCSLLEEQGFSLRGKNMLMREMNGFLPALRTAKNMRPNVKASVWRAVSEVYRTEFREVRITPGMIVRWAEFLGGCEVAA